MKILKLNICKRPSEYDLYVSAHTHIFLSLSLHQEHGPREYGVSGLDFFDRKVIEVSCCRSSIQLATATLMDVMVVHKHTRNSK